MIPPVLLLHRDGHVFLRSVPFAGRSRAWIEGDGRAAGHFGRVERLLRAEGIGTHVGDRAVGRHVVTGGHGWTGDGGDLAVALAILSGTLRAAMGLVTQTHPGDPGLATWEKALGTPTCGGWSDEPPVIWAGLGRLASDGAVEAVRGWPDALLEARRAAPEGARFELFCAESSRSLMDAMAKEAGMRADVHAMTDVHALVRAVPGRLAELLPAERWAEARALAHLP